MHKRIYTLVLAVIIIAILVVSFWAYSTGKFAGLADIVKTTEKGVTITTKDSQGNLISGVLIRAYAYANNSWSEDSNLSGSTVDGKFHIYPPNLTDDKYKLFCEDSSPITALKFKPELTGSTFLPAESNSISKDNICNTLTEITFIASSGSTGDLTGTIYGYVSDDSGNKLNGVRVSALVNGQEIDFTSTANDKNGTAGYYIFTSLSAPYTYTIKAEKTGYNSAEASVALKSGDNVQKDLEMSLKPDETKFIYEAQVYDSVSSSLIKDVSVTIAASPAIPGFASWSGTTKDTPIDSTKYGQANIVALKLPAPPAGYYNCTQNYNVTFKNDAFEDAQRTFTCQDIKLNTSLNSYAYNGGKISLTLKAPDEFLLLARVINKQDGSFVHNIWIDVSVGDYQLGHAISQSSELSLGKKKLAANLLANIYGVINYKVNVRSGSLMWDDLCGSSLEKCGVQISKNEIKKKDIVYDSNLEQWVVRIEVIIDYGEVFRLTVRDNETKRPIPGAEVELFDHYSNFSIKKTTDNYGDVKFYSSKIIWHCFTSSKSINEQRVRVSAPGYITQIFTGGLDHTDFCHFSRDIISIINLEKDPGGQDTVLQGRVYDEKNNQPIGEAKVSLFSDVRGLPISFATTDSNGDFQFTNLVPDEYTLSVFHLNYKSTPNSNLRVEMKRGQKVKIYLGLESYADEIGIGELNVYAIRQKTLEPIPGLEVVLVYDGQSETETTKNDGAAVFVNPPPGRNYLVRIFDPSQSNKQLTERTVNIPVNWLELSAPEQQKILAKFVFLLDDGKIDLSKKAKIQFKISEETSQKPIEAAKIILKTRFGINFEGITNAAGIAIFPDNFDISVPNDLGLYRGDFSRAIIDFKPIIGEEYEFEVTKEGYQSDMGELIVNSNNQEKNIKLKFTGPLLEVVLKDYSRYGIDAGVGNRIIGKLILERKEGNNYVPVANADKKASLIFIDYYGLPKGHYRVRIEGQPPSETVYFDAKTKATIRYGFCGIGDDDTRLVKINQSFYFFLSGDKAKTIYQTNEGFFLGLANTIKRLQNQSTKLEPIVLAIVPGPMIFGANTINASAFNGGYSGGCLQINNPYVMNITDEFIYWVVKNNRPDDIIYTIYHEYGHLVYENRYLLKNTSFYQRWKNIFSELSTLNNNLSQCIWNSIKDGNISMVPRSLGGHPQDNDHEMFASFFSAYFFYHDRLYGIIQYHVEKNSNCQNLLKYMWQLFSENVGKVYGNDDQIFNPVGGKIGNATYTWHQIINGDWMESKYKDLSWTDKAKIQFQRTVGPLINKAGSSLSNAVRSFNAWLDKLFNSIGLINTGSVTGVVQDEDNKVLANTVVQIGSRAALTDGVGRFTATRVPTGNQSIVVKKSSQEDYLVLEPAPANMTINQNQNQDIIIRVR